MCSQVGELQNGCAASLRRGEVILGSGDCIAFQLLHDS